ncbi:MAG: hypothetical protein D6702_10780, partial [Planctomycetota bacterium]
MSRMRRIALGRSTWLTVILLAVAGLLVAILLLVHRQPDERDRSVDSRQKAEPQRAESASSGPGAGRSTVPLEVLLSFRDSLSHLPLHQVAAFFLGDQGEVKWRVGREASLPVPEEACPLAIVFSPGHVPLLLPGPFDKPLVQEVDPWAQVTVRLEDVQGEPLVGVPVRLRLGGAAPDEVRSLLSTVVGLPGLVEAATAGPEG